MGWPADPVIYEINTAVWLEALARACGRPVTLADVPAVDWDAVCLDGVDAIWLMGVWARSPAGLDIARDNVDLMGSLRGALPDLTDADVIGSPYCVRDYAVEPAFGGPDGLAMARAALASRGKRLILDYVPNHVAPDHGWVVDHPDRFISGDDADLASDPQAWLRVGDHVLAHGRDPYFPPWPDVVQLNAFSRGTRQATADTLGEIAEQCDGIRCDMAMLMTNNVFAKTWGAYAGSEPVDDFWPTVIAALRHRHPGTVLIAEAYWDMEWELQQQGFDFCYDKRLYDRLVESDVEGVRAHLRADVTYQSRLLRFLENHDEPRVATRLTPEAEHAAALMIATLPGATLWHEGQFEGRRVRPPVFLTRRPDEPIDADLTTWYRRMLATLSAVDLRSGRWRLLDTGGWPDNDSHRALLAWSWGEVRDDRHLIVVNASASPAQGRVALPWTDLGDRRCRLVDLMTGLELIRDGSELLDPGLYVSLDGWRFHVLAVD